MCRLYVCTIYENKSLQVISPQYTQYTCEVIHFEIIIFHYYDLISLICVKYLKKYSKLLFIKCLVVYFDVIASI